MTPHQPTRRSLLRAFATIALAAIPTVSGGCDRPLAPSASPETTATAPLRIVATTPMLGDLARRIAPTAATETLLGEGVDPHLYKPTRTDIVSLLNADVIVANGLFLEGRMRDAFARAADAGRSVVEVGASLPSDELLHEGGSHGQPDPHIWMDPTLWSRAGAHLAARLGERAPASAARFAAHSLRFAELASELERNAIAAFATVPSDRRILVTAHDAFGYFGRRFGLEVHAIQGISTESEAGLADLESLVTFLVERRVPAVFVESTVSPRTIEALIAGAKARGHEVRIGGELYSDSMGKAGTSEGTWPGMIAHNVATVVNALGGSTTAESLIPKEWRDVAPEASR